MTRNITVREKPLSIMVVEDCQEHLISAQVAFSDRDIYKLQIFDGYDRASYAVFERSSLNPLGSKELQYDVVLTDFMIPYFGCERDSVPEDSDGKIPKPFGLPLALKAAMHGVKHVAVVSLGNHHKERDIFGLEGISKKYGNEEPRDHSIIRVNDSRVLVTTCPPTFGRMDVADPNRHVKNGIGEYLIKNWAKVLEILMEE